MMLAFQTFGISDMNKQREQINGICILFCGVAVISFVSQFLQVCVSPFQHVMCHWVICTS